MPHEQGWGFPAALYLFVSGMSAAAFYIGVTADIIGKGRYKNVARIGSYLVMVPIAIGLLALITELGQPLRFWHLMLQLGPLNQGIIFYPNSVMSLGTWILVVFSMLCGIAYPLLWLSEERFAQRIPALPALAGREGLRRVLGLLGLPFAVLVAAYTGVLLASTSTPMWANTPLLPILFVVSATSTGFAAIMFVMSIGKRDDHAVVSRLEQGDNFMIKLELAVVAALFIALLFTDGAAGAIGNVMFGEFAVLFWVGFIAVGLLIPLALQRYSLQSRGGATGNLAVMSAILVLFGGFYLRYIILLAA